MGESGEVFPKQGWKRLKKRGWISCGWLSFQELNIFVPEVANHMPMSCMLHEFDLAYI